MTWHDLAVSTAALTDKVTRFLHVLPRCTDADHGAQPAAIAA